MAHLFAAATAQLLIPGGSMVPAESFTAEFPLEHEEWLTAARIADRCSDFAADVEEEQIADDACSCYNCRYRRWSLASIVCCRQ